MKLIKLEKSTYATEDKKIVIYADYKKKDGHFSHLPQSWSFTVRLNDQVKNVKGLGSKKQAAELASKIALIK